ncbi:hypothetical protein FRACYDRAFT_240232 [Fragilariopsis cylindrus CCMP1102]|uniref:S1 motif domain-containing protein n=1 Tax=Fragilariopsis cylindrus CCMP1102 TaxID=635003 RepID=A0A1E7FBK2_9STRA|nr:hypothetical protein FRACYDRAFT_240232 [Fragilariopsis cylindrus CCMP1102]|eukprot:OEU15541.1 hypothetical protein FRACYDRAFT_240232 [Fragilariopsis cylindrus CCMP1102]
MAGGEGAKERRRLKRLAETTKDASPEKNQGKNSGDNKYTSPNRKDSSTRQQNGRNTTGNRFNKYDRNNNNNNKARSNTKSNNATPAKKKVKKPKHLKRKLEQASKENDQAVETIKKEMQDFKYKKEIIRNNSKRQRIDADDDGADAMFVVGPNTPGVFARTKKVDVEDADATMAVVGPNTPGVYSNNKNNAEIKSTNDDDEDDNIDMIDDRGETKSDDDSDSDSSVDSSSDDDSSNEERKDDVGESHRQKETITNDGNKKYNAEITPIKKAEIKPTKKVEIKPIKKAEIKPTKKVDIKPIKKAEIKSTKKVEIKPINNNDKAKTKSDNEDTKNDAGESLQRKENIADKKGDEISTKKGAEKEKIVASTVTDNEQDIKAKSIPEFKSDNNNNPSDDTTEKGKTRYCVGRKPVTDYTLGSSYPAEVVYVKPFGVFFDIGCHSDAFCHVSRLRDDFVESPETMFKEGDKVATVRVVEIDRRRKRITVSLQSESRAEDERKSIDARRTRTDSRKLKARKNEARFQSKPTTTDHIEQSIQKKDPVVSIEKKAPVVIRASAYAPRAPAYAPTKTYNDPSMMAPADLKRARKLARRAERRSKAEA